MNGGEGHEGGTPKNAKTLLEMRFYVEFW